MVEFDDPQEFIQIIDRATALARREANSTGVSSAHLLVAVFETNDVLQRQLLESGVDRQTIITELNLETIITGPALPIDFDLNWSQNAVTSARRYNDIQASESEAVLFNSYKALSVVHCNLPSVLMNSHDTVICQVCS